MYGALGVGFSQSEFYSIMLTVKKLGEDPVKELKTVRHSVSPDSRDTLSHWFVVRTLPSHNSCFLGMRTAEPPFCASGK